MPPQDADLSGAAAGSSLTGCGSLTQIIADVEPTPFACLKWFLNIGHSTLGLY